MILTQVVIAVTSQPQRHFYCRRCGKDHPGVDCMGKRIECRYCMKEGHRAFECYSNPESHSYRPPRGTQRTPAAGSGASHGGQKGPTPTYTRSQKGKEVVQGSGILNSTGASGAEASAQCETGNPENLDMIVRMCLCV